MDYPWLDYCPNLGSSKSSTIKMKKLTLTITALLFLGGSTWAGSYRVHYSIRGSGRNITVQAESTAEARRTVMDMFPGAVVTGAPRSLIGRRVLS
jgi:hypothetical protein